MCLTRSIARLTRSRSLVAKALREARRFDVAVAVTALWLVASVLSGCAANAEKSSGTTAVGDSTGTDPATIERILGGWRDLPRLGARQLIDQYGLPQAASNDMLVWTKAQPFKRITVMNIETPHAFPLPHVDYMEHTVSYSVPQAKVADVIAMDGSTTINKTAGEMSARCDLEAHNVLTLNLNHDIATGKRTVSQARQQFGKVVEKEITGQGDPSLESLQFEPQSIHAAAFMDQPVIQGAPVPASTPGVKGGKEAEVLATVLAIDRMEIAAAMAAAKEKGLSNETRQYAEMLHKEHGENAARTMDISHQLGVQPVESEAVMEMKMQGARTLADLIPLQGKEFERGYLDAMVKGHTEALNKIDHDLMNAAEHAEVKRHLTETRTHVAAHLEQAKKLLEQLGKAGA